jgi:hypothetical protein
MLHVFHVLRRRIPLHCAVEKLWANLELVHLLLSAYPEGASAIDDDGFTPIGTALKWEHSDAVLRAMLMCNRFQYRGLYFAMRYGKLLGSLFHCFECTFNKPITRYETAESPCIDLSSISAEGPENPHRLTNSADTEEHKADTGAKQEHPPAPALYISPASSSKALVSDHREHKRQTSYPEIVLGDQNTDSRDAIE